MFTSKIWICFISLTLPVNVMDCPCICFFIRLVTQSVLHCAGRENCFVAVYCFQTWYNSNHYSIIEFYMFYIKPLWEETLHLCSLCCIVAKCLNIWIWKARLLVISQLYMDTPCFGYITVWIMKRLTTAAVMQSNVVTNRWSRTVTPGRQDCGREADWWKSAKLL